MPLPELVRRLWFFLHRDRMSAELAEEMRLHEELRARRERGTGARADEAALMARRRFGNRALLVEESRDQWRLRWLDELATDLRHGLRSLRGAPLPSAIILVILSAGIGATLAAFTAMDAALFRPLPVREPEGLFVLPRGDVQTEGSRPRTSPLSLEVLRAQREVYQDVGAYAAGGMNLSGGVAPQRVQAGLVTPSTLRLLGVQPALGRIFVEEEGELGAPDVVVISDRLWRSQFGGDEAVVGRGLALNDREYEVIGVMPPRFAFPARSDLWIPLTVPLSLERVQVFSFLIVTDRVVRLAPGVTAAQADAHFIARAREMGFEPPAGDGRPLPAIHQPLRGYFIGDSDTRLGMVMGLATLLLIASCANVGGILLARWSARRREMAVRAAIGAGRGRLLRQLATESGLLIAASALGGIVIAHGAMHAFSTLMPAELAALTPPVVGGRTLTVLLALVVLLTVATGALPAMAASGGDLTRPLRTDSGVGPVRPGRWHIGSALVVTEVTLAVVLLVGSGLLVKSLIRLHAVDTGINADGVVTARIALSMAKYPTPAARVRFRAQLEQELREGAALEHAALVSTLPLRGEWHPAVAFDLPDRPGLEHAPFAELVYTTPEYFETMGIRLLAGRWLVPEDSLPGGGAVISESIAREWWPDGSALGARLRSGPSGERTIVGVVSDVHGTPLDGERQPQLYTAMTGIQQATIVVRSTLPAREALARIRNAVQRVDSSQVVYDMKTMDQVVADAVAPRRATSALASIFGTMTLLLAALGLYGLLAYSVVRRTPELGIRLALGARRSQVVRSVVGRSVWLVMLGTTIGLGTAFWLARYLQPVLFEVAPDDATIYVVAPIVLLVVAVVAAAVPAIRAARLDPMRVLRAD